MATRFIGHLSQVFCTRSHGAIDCKKTAGEQTTGFCAFWTGRMGCAAMCFLYELLKLGFFLKYYTRIEFVLCVVVQHPDAKPLGILEEKKQAPKHLIFKGAWDLSYWNVWASPRCLSWSGRGTEIKELHGRAAPREGGFWGIIANIIVKLVLFRSRLLFTWNRLQNQVWMIQQLL